MYLQKEIFFIIKKVILLVGNICNANVVICNLILKFILISEIADRRLHPDCKIGL